MAHSLAALSVRLDLQSAQFQKGVDQATRQLQKTNTQMSAMSKNAQQLGSQLKNAFAGVVAGATLSRFVSETKQAIQQLDAIAKAADRVGVAVESFQELTFAANRSGLSVTQLESSLQRFGRSLGEARQNTGTLASNLAKYDAALLENLKNTKDQDEALALFANKMASIKDPTEQAYLANLAFGRAGAGMITILRNGSAGLEEFRKQARDAGVVIEESLTRKAEVLNDRWDTLTEAFSTRFAKGLTIAADAALKFFGTYNDEAELNSKILKTNVELTKLRIEEEKNLYGYQSGRKKRIKELEEEMAALEAQLEPIVRLRKARDDLANQSLLGEGGGITDEAQKALEKLKSEADKLTESLRTPFEVLEAELENLDSLYEKGLISFRTYVRAASEAEERFDQSFKSIDESIKSLGTTESLNDFNQSMESFRQSLISSQAEMDLLPHKVEVLNAAFADGAIDVELYDQKMKQLNEQMGLVDDSANQLSESMKVAFGQTLANGVDRLVDNIFEANQSFKQFAADFLRDVARMITKLMLLNAVQQTFPSLFPNAKGNAFQNGNVIPFARGGVVTGPTVFPFSGGTGLMGEAGPEAIMPLGRTASGELGVKGSATTVNIINNSGGQASVKESEEPGGGKRIDVLIEGAVDSAIARGRFDKSFNNLYGIRRRGA